MSSYPSIVTLFFDAFWCFAGILGILGVFGTNRKHLPFFILCVFVYVLFFILDFCRYAHICNL